VRVPAALRAPRRARGEAVTEFVLLAPILLFILFGILEIGRLVDAWIVVHNAAREGARSGATAFSAAAERNGTLDDYVAGVAADAAAEYLRVETATRRDWVADDAASSEVLDEDVSVTASLRITLYTPLIGVLLDASSIPVRATATMRRQV
jgi:Flp pilus assembly protein TadG